MTRGKKSFCLSFSEEDAGICLSILISSRSTLFLIIITPHLPLFAPFVINFVFNSLTSLICMTPHRWTVFCSVLCYHWCSLLLSAACPSPQAKAWSHPFHSCLLSAIHPPFLLPSLPLRIFPTTHSRLSLPAALSTRQVVCVYHKLISADTCSTLPPTLFPLSLHTHTRAGGGERKA